MTELEEQIKQAGVERQRRYPLLDITNNREEIRAIAQAAQDYMVELNSDVKRIKVWEAIPRMVIEFIQGAFTKLSKDDALKQGESSIIIGDIMELGIEYMGTADGDKQGNLTPVVHCRSEFKWENNLLPYHDEISVDEARVLREENCEGLPAQFFENRKEIKEVCMIARRKLEDCGIILPESDWWILALTVVAFFRKTKEYLVEHKDDGEIGVEIDFANLLKIAVTKEGGLEEGDPVDYILSITPNQIFKKDFAKGDDTTEK